MIENHLLLKKSLVCQTQELKLFTPITVFLLFTGLSAVKSFLLEQSYKRQSLSIAPHREDCESFLRAMCSRSQVRALGALLSKHTLMDTHTNTQATGEEVRRRKEGGGGAERRQVRPLFSLSAVGEISLFLTGK